MGRPLDMTGYKGRAHEVWCTYTPRLGPADLQCNFRSRKYTQITQDWSHNTSIQRRWEGPPQYKQLPRSRTNFRACQSVGSTHFNMVAVSFLGKKHITSQPDSLLQRYIMWVFSTMEVISTYSRYSEKVYMCFYDLQKAFDSIQYPVLVKCLYKSWVNGKVWRIL